MEESLATNGKYEFSWTTPKFSIISKTYEDCLQCKIITTITITIESRKVQL